MNGASVSQGLPPLESLNAIDSWILSRLDETVADVSELLEAFEFARASEIIYHFAWDDLCDWYVELYKEAFASSNSEPSQRVLGFVLDQLFRLMHPIMPFLTEELWTSFTGGESLVIASWPIPNSSHRNKASEKIVEKLQEIVTEVRRFRNDQGIKTSQRVPARFSLSKEIESYESALRYVLRLGSPTRRFCFRVALSKHRLEEWN